MPKVSVITPVYNAEKYVERAIVSLMEQTLDDVEFIIIDDGSKDNSFVIIQQVIERYPSRKEQVTLISRENQGVAATRAQGMKLAKGEYTIHLDSDDWVELGWLESMYNAAKKDNADIVVCNYRMIYTKRIVTIQQKVSSTGKECIKNLLTGDVGSVNWDKLVRSSLYVDNNINFVGGLDMGEDFLVNLRLFFFANKISHVSSVLYNYNRENDNSLTKSYSEKSLNDIVKVIDLAELFLKKNNTGAMYNKEILLYKLNIRACFTIQARGNLYIKKRGLNLYPETDFLVKDSGVSRFFKITFFLNAYRLLFLHRVVDFVLLNYLRFRRLS